MLALENVCKTYRTRRLRGGVREVQAVRNLSLALEAGAFGLLGVNGAGKTTTIKMISTLLLPTSGRILLDGLDVVRDAVRVRSRLNMIVGGERMLYYRLTGRENLLYFASLYGLAGRQARTRVGELLELVGLGGQADTRVEQYSKGMKQRLSIARGLVNDPDYLFLDEPTLGLDVKIARELRTFIKGTLVGQRGKTIILTSHYMDEIEELCPRLGILSAGELIFLGSAEDLYRRLGLRLVHTFEVREELPGGLEALERALRLPLQPCPARDATWSFQVHTDEEIAQRVFETLATLGVRRVSYQVARPSLEEALLLLTKEEVPA